MSRDQILLGGKAVCVVGHEQKRPVRAFLDGEITRGVIFVKILPNPVDGVAELSGALKGHAFDFFYGHFHLDVVEPFLRRYGTGRFAGVVRSIENDIVRQQVVGRF